MSFQQQHGILVASPAAYDRPPASSRWLIESSRRYGIELTLLGQGQPYPNNRHKIRLVAEHLRQHPEYHYVLQADFKDVVFCASLREMFSKYQSLGHDIVVCGERNCWPMPSHAERSPDLGTSFRYLNSGLIFATAAAWVAAWSAMEERERLAGGQPLEIGLARRHVFSSDQAAWSDLYGRTAEAEAEAAAGLVVVQAQRPQHVAGPGFRRGAGAAAGNRDLRLCQQQRGALHAREAAVQVVRQPQARDVQRGAVPLDTR